MKQKVNITNKSISNSVTNDYKHAICEYVWNGFDAGATIVELNYTADELYNVSSLSISDNGSGIDRRTLHDTFGAFMDSVKKGKSYQWDSQVKGKNGKGRYAFNCFATKAEWVSIYKHEDKLLKHTISINKGDNDHYNDGGTDSIVIVNDANTGTVVNFYNTEISVNALKSKEFLDYVTNEFAGFLQLNSHEGKNLFINGKRLIYEEIIADSLTNPIKIFDEREKKNYNFEVTFIRWSRKIRENYYCYFLDFNKYLKYKTTTSFNNKDTGFHHSVYVSSNYFENFVFENHPDYEKDLFNKRTPKDAVYKELNKKIRALLFKEQKKYVREVQAQNLINSFEENGVIRKPKNEYDQHIINDLKRTIKEIYCVQPKIFVNVKQVPSKTLVGFLELLLDSERREDVITILESVVSLSDEERKNLVDVLKSTTLSHITDTIKLLQNRVRTVSAIKHAIYDKSFGVNEIDDLQKMISEAFWLFGEQYNIVTEAEPDFNQALKEYLNKLQNVEGYSASRINLIDDVDKNKEMDVFAFRQNCFINKIDNIVVELKHPNVRLGEKQLSQVKTYMKVILSAGQFNAQNMEWKYYLVGTDYDKSGYIEGEIESQKNWGERFLVHKRASPITHSIYVVKWSEIFAEFEMRHNFLLKKLQLKREQLIANDAKDKTELHKIVSDSKENK